MAHLLTGDCLLSALIISTHERCVSAHAKDPYYPFIDERPPTNADLPEVSQMAPSVKDRAPVARTRIIIQGAPPPVVRARAQSSRTHSTFETISSSSTCSALRFCARCRKFDPPALRAGSPLG